MRGSGLFHLPALLGLSDEDLMLRVRQSDDTGAFTQLVRRWERPIQRLCARMTGDVHRGEDVAQETFVRLFAARKDYENTAKFSTFLWRIALNLCHDERRRVERRRESSLDDENGEAYAVVGTWDAGGLPADELLVERELADAVKTALLRLPEPCRAVVVLRHYERLKFREIADVLGVPEGTVKSRMTDALLRLSRMLKPTYEELEDRSQEPGDALSRNILKGARIQEPESGTRIQDDGLRRKR